MRPERRHLVVLEYDAVGCIRHGGDHRSGVQVLGELYLRTERNLQPVGIDVDCLESIPYLRGGNGHVVCLDGQGVFGGSGADRAAVLSGSYDRAVLVPFGGTALDTGCQCRRVADG
ncbi:hypothetical protein [Bacteroides stercoris]|uniref:hypothetical protein n=1 Tax=Bacteroides stercoris TaxID=46506 RepID=UPI001CEF5924|nr:hypothetical protein [Bacteroides stercoris]